MFRTFAIMASLAVATVVTTAQASAEPNAVQYELAERCGKDAAAFFKNLDYNDASYSNHYNPDLNGCYMMVNNRFTRDRKLIESRWELWDVIENVQLGMLFLHLSADDYKALGPRPADSPIPEIAACLTGWFNQCHRDPNFNSLVERYMQRLTGW